MVARAVMTIRIKPSQLKEISESSKNKGPRSHLFVCVASLVSLRLSFKLFPAGQYIPGGGVGGKASLF